MAFTKEQEAACRIAAFEWLRTQVELHDDLLPRTLLLQGFEFDGFRIPLLGPSGIFKPAAFELVPLSITTIPGAYDDEIRDEGDFIHYKYRDEGGPDHRDNEGLRTALRSKVPLVYFYRESPGKYLTRFPAFIARDDRATSSFDVQFDHVRSGYPVIASSTMAQDGSGLDLHRAWITREAKVRLHQQKFRGRVLRAYTERCSICKLAHRRLLDAAHIIPDGDPRGEATVRNGLSLCKIHHAAFDARIIGISPDSIVKVREDVLSEVDGPMLQFGIQDLNDKPLVVVPEEPSQRPAPELLEIRYKQFLSQ